MLFVSTVIGIELTTFILQRPSFAGGLLDWAALLVEIAAAILLVRASLRRSDASASLELSAQGNSLQHRHGPGNIAQNAIPLRILGYLTLVFSFGFPCLLAWQRPFEAAMALTGAFSTVFVPVGLAMLGEAGRQRRVVRGEKSAAPRRLNTLPRHQGRRCMQTDRASHSSCEENLPAPRMPSPRLPSHQNKASSHQNSYLQNLLSLLHNKANNDRD